MPRCPGHVAMRHRSRCDANAEKSYRSPPPSHPSPFLQPPTHQDLRRRYSHWVYRMRHTIKEESTLRRLRLEESPRADRPGLGGEAAPVMRAIIVDPEAAARRTLNDCCAREPDLYVVAEYSDSAVALEAVRESAPAI